MATTTSIEYLESLESADDEEGEDSLGTDDFEKRTQQTEAVTG
jgi:hypothetical protein